jgi:3-dehydroquinate synthase
MANSPTYQVPVDLGDRSYSIDIGESLWDHLADSVQELFAPTRVVVITDETVGELYESRLFQAFYNRPWKATVHRMRAGEQHKTLATLQALYSDILDSGCDRKTPVLAMGGGVPGDTGGFVAATLLRGLPYIQMPTTLLAMVDSSVGGKTGVDMPQGKNLVGAFYQPSLVVASIDTLETLPAREFAAGMAEVIKYGVIWDATLFESLERDMAGLVGGNPEERLWVIRRCCEIKAEVVSKDERESGLREILNFGHTVGHAIEAATEYGSLLHGEAISIGMLVETALAEVLGEPLGDLRSRLKDLLEKAGLPTTPPEGYSLERIWDLMHADKKARAGKVRMVLPKSLGKVASFGDISREAFEQAWTAC